MTPLPIYPPSGPPVQRPRSRPRGGAAPATPLSPAAIAGVAAVLVVLIAIASVLYYKNMSKNRKIIILKQRLKSSVQTLKAILQLELQNISDASPEQLSARHVDVLRRVEGLHLDENPNSTDYFFILDTSGRSWASGRVTRTPASPAAKYAPVPLLGSLHVESEHVHPVHQIIELAQRGGGFLEYKWNHPVHSDEKHSKVTYAHMIDNTPFILCRGGYLDDA